MTPDPSVEEASKPGLIALASVTRRRILQLLTRKDSTIAELVELTGLHRATIRHHLQILVNADLVEEARRNGTHRAGRPAVIYAAKSNPKIVGYPVRQYQMLSEMAIHALTKELGREKAGRLLEEIARERGVELIRYLEATTGVDDWTPDTYAEAFVHGAARQMGMDSEVMSLDDEHVRYRMFSCPFQEIAEKDVELICERLDRGFHKGVLTGLGSKPVMIRHACIGHGSPHCEYELRWLKRKDRPDGVSVRHGNAPAVREAKA